jgi:phage repressor protein C with HTH and peptisase S24 domain
MNAANAGAMRELGGFSADNRAKARKTRTMLRHKDIWKAIDRLAEKNGLSPSGLARRSGLDPTTFNKSKRIAPGGKARWPSTESIAKILDHTGESMPGFVALIGEKGKLRRKIPLLGYARAGRAGYFDDSGNPAGEGWEEVELPGLHDDGAYALKITGDSMEPAYRSGDIIIVSPAAEVRRGDRVVVRTRSGEVMAKQLSKRNAKRTELKSLNERAPDVALDSDEVAWIARILWVSQ